MNLLDPDTQMMLSGWLLAAVSGAICWLSAAQIHAAKGRESVRDAYEKNPEWTAAWLRRETEVLPTDSAESEDISD